jgi:hypothetical protein
MVATFIAPEVGIMAALLLLSAVFIYFGWRGILDTFTLRVSDINPVYWFFRWRYRAQPRAVADRAFLRFLWSLFTVLWVATAIRTLIEVI